MSSATRERVREIILGLGQRDASKEAVRRVLLRRRGEVARALPASVRSQERRALALLQKPRYPDVRPVLRRIASSDGDLWTFLRVTLSSAPWTGRPGRLLRYLVTDENTGGILGVVDLGSEVMALSPRDRLIGWDQRTKLRGGGLRRVVNLGTCVCAQPFGWLCGGKFIAEAIASRDVADAWRTKYGDELALACTTSLYGKSSQYNRLRSWIYLGDTPGASPHIMLSEAEKRILRAFVSRTGRISRTGGYGGDLGGAMDVLSKAALHAGIPAKQIGRGQPRGVYVSELYPGAIADLRSGAISGRAERTAADARDWWVQRWRDMRFPKVREQIQDFDWSDYTLQSVIRAGRLASEAAPSQGDQDGATPIPALSPSVASNPDE